MIPWLQVSRADVQNLQFLANYLETTQERLFLALYRLREYALDHTATATEPPSGVLNMRSQDAMAFVGSIFNYKDTAKLVDGLKIHGFVEWVNKGGNLCVTGMEKYARLWLKNNRPNQAKRKQLKTANGIRVPLGSRDKQLKNQYEISETAGQVPEDVYIEEIESKILSVSSNAFNLKNVYKNEGEKPFASGPDETGTAARELPISKPKTKPPNPHTDNPSPPAASGPKSATTTKTARGEEGSPKPVDTSSLRALSDRLCDTFRQIRGVKYSFQGAKDAKALKKLQKSGSAAEIDERWRLGLRVDPKQWLYTGTLAQLAAKWNDLAALLPPQPDAAAYEARAARLAETNALRISRGLPPIVFDQPAASGVS